MFSILVDLTESVLWNGKKTKQYENDSFMQTEILFLNIFIFRRRRVWFTKRDVSLSVGSLKTLSIVQSSSRRSLKFGFEDVTEKGLFCGRLIFFYYFHLWGILNRLLKIEFKFSFNFKTQECVTTCLLTF